MWLGKVVSCAAGGEETQCRGSDGTCVRRRRMEEEMAESVLVHCLGFGLVTPTFGSAPVLRRATSAESSVPIAI